MRRKKLFLSNINFATIMYCVKDKNQRILCALKNTHNINRKKWTKETKLFALAKNWNCFDYYIKKLKFIYIYGFYFIFYSLSFASVSKWFRTRLNKTATQRTFFLILNMMMNELVGVMMMTDM